MVGSLGKRVESSKELLTVSLRIRGLGLLLFDGDCDEDGEGDDGGW